MEYRCAKKVAEVIEHQLSRQAYFNKDVSEETGGLIWKAPTVNSSCESHFAVIDWHAIKHGGSMPISIVSYAQVVSYNRFLGSKEMKHPILELNTYELLEVLKKQK